MDYVSILLGIAVVQLLGAASPGPNFIVVTSYSIGASRRCGMFVVCGILLATLTWAILAACGLGVLVVQFPAAYTALQLLSAIYLVWLGARILGSVVRGNDADAIASDARPVTAWHAVRMGFLTSMTNPKAVAYYSSLFVVMIPPESPSWLFAAAVGTALFVSASWWVTVALFFAAGPVRRSYERGRRTIDAIMGGALVLLGVRMAVSGR